MPTNKQKCDYYLKRMDDPTPGPCDTRYAAEGQRELFIGGNRVPELVTVGLDPGPRSCGMVITGPAMRSFIAPVLFAGECGAEETIARVDMALENLRHVVMEWAATNPHIKIKNRYLDDTIGQQWIIREGLLRLGVRLFCVPRQHIIAQLGVPAFLKGKRDKHVRTQLDRMGYDTASDTALGTTHTQAALAAALLNVRHPDNAKWLVEPQVPILGRTA